MDKILNDDGKRFFEPSSKFLELLQFQSPN